MTTKKTSKLVPEQITVENVTDREHLIALSVGDIIIQSDGTHRRVAHKAWVRSGPDNWTADIYTLL